jgi:transcriptional/translational regulatory protein YebC/TACO1
MKRTGNTYDITCDPSIFPKVHEALQTNNIPTEHSEITQLAKAPIDADMESARKIIRLMEALDDHDDVQNVYSDLNMTEEVMAELAKE